MKNSDDDTGIQGKVDAGRCKHVNGLYGVRFAKDVGPNLKIRPLLFIQGAGKYSPHPLF